ncbi:MAG TPA: hypothetical protein VF475_16250 [Sphingobium sp.]
MKLALWLGFCLVAYFGFGWWKLKGNDRRLAASRVGLSDDDLLTALVASGADAQSAQSVIQWIRPYYGRLTTPHLDDHLDSDLRIDPDDIGFFVSEFYRDHRIPQPTRKKPDVLPDYPGLTLKSLALYLTKKRSAAVRALEVSP